MSIRSFLPSRRLLATCALGAAVVAVSACGSSSPSSSTASAGSGGTSTTSATYQARLNLAKCMRAHGVNLPDPSPTGPPIAGGFRALSSSPNFQSALQACAQYRQQAFGLANVSPAQRAQFQKGLVKFAECMRAHNIDIPDPTTSTGGAFGIFRQITPSERNSPAFQSAFQACSTTLPFRPGGGAGGGGSGA